MESGISQSEAAKDTRRFTQRGIRNCQTGALEDANLPIQRQMIGIFANQNLSQETGSGDALVNDVRGNWRLDQCFALIADPFATHMALDREDTWLVPSSIKQLS